jgi:hypothetical protein
MEEDVLINPDDLTFAVLVMPPIIAVINQRAWSKEVKGLVGLAACAVYAFLVALWRKQLIWSDWRDIVLQVGLGTFVSYKAFFGPTNIGPHIEAATSVGTGRRRPGRDRRRPPHRRDPLRRADRGAVRHPHPHHTKRTKYPIVVGVRPVGRGRRTPGSASTRNGTGREKGRAPPPGDPPFCRTSKTAPSGQRARREGQPVERHPLRVELRRAVERDDAIRGDADVRGIGVVAGPFRGQRQDHLK